MTEKQLLSWKDVFFRIKQFYFGVSDKPLSAAHLTAGEASEYTALLKQKEAELSHLAEEGAADDAATMLAWLSPRLRQALTEKDLRLAGDLAALGVRLLGVYTFPFMNRVRFWKKCVLPVEREHGILLFAEHKEAFLSGASRALWLSPAFSRTEGHYYEDDADDALRAAHPIVYGAFVFLGVLLFLGSIVGFGLLAGLAFSLSSPYLILGYLGAAAFGVGLYSLSMSFIHQYMGHTLTLLLGVGGVLLMLLSVGLAL